MWTDDDVYVYLVDLPVDEAVCPCDAFGYTIYINARLNSESRLRAFQHALRHIRNNDFEKTEVQQIESEAHR